MNQSKKFLERYGKWAIVTGASDGIGKQFAIQLAGLGFNLILIARRKHLLEELAQSLNQQYGVDYRIFDLDLCQPEACSYVINNTQTLDIGLLVASAGYGSSGDMVDSNIEDEMKMIDLNCKSLLLLSHVYGKRFSLQKRGGIILMSSLLAFQGATGSANYAATKAYVQTLAEGIHRELKRDGVDVIAVAPGPVKTGFEERGNFKFGFASRPKIVAQEAIGALGKKITVRPGFISKFLELSLSMLIFRNLRVLVMGRVMSGMIKHY